MKQITPADLEPFRESGVVAAAKALRRSTRTINAIAKAVGFEFSTHTPSEMDRRRRDRSALSERLASLAAQGLSQREICEITGITRAVLRSTAEEHYININNHSKELRNKP